MTKAERTKQFIIEKAAPIFNVKGYDATSMSDIQSATKLSRGALYGNFEDKNKLALAAYDYNFNLSYQRTKLALAKVPSAKEKLLIYSKHYFTDWQGVLNRGGCPMINAAVEADDHLDYLRESVRTSIKMFIYMLQVIIEDGIVNNEFKNTLDASKYAAYLFSIMEGNIMLAKIMDDPKYLQIASQQLSLIIENEMIT